MIIITFFSSFPYISEKNCPSGSAETGTEAIILPLQSSRFRQLSNQFLLIMTSEVCGFVWVCLWCFFSCNYGNESLKYNEIHENSANTQMFDSRFFSFYVNKKEKEKYNGGDMSKTCWWMYFCFGVSVLLLSGRFYHVSRGI